MDLTSFAVILTLFALLLAVEVQSTIVKRHHNKKDKERNRSLYIKKTINLLLEAASPSNPGLTCWTCPHMSSNGECNDWAPDTPCSPDHSVCKSIHHVNVMTGESVAVSKTCARPIHCTPDHVGCHASHIANVMTCVSCCTDSYCNEAIPHNSVTSLQLSRLASGATPRHSALLTAGLSAILWTVLQL